MPTWARVLILQALVLLAGCRATNPTREAEMESVGDKTWFDQYGDPVECEVPAGGCVENTYDKTFVDLCVAKGFQAKSCGCTAGCSGKIPGKVKPVVKTPAELKAAEACGKDDRDAAAAAAQAQGPTGKCYVDAVCNGDPSECNADERKVTTHLRALARGGCKDAVLGALCAAGTKDTLGCADKDVDVLAALYSKAFDKSEASLRRCVRERFCNKSQHGCADAELKVTAAAAPALEQKACSYWLASICSIDGK